MIAIPRLRRRAVVVAAAALLVLAGVPAVQLVTSDPAHAACTPVTVIIARGTNETAGTSGRLQTLYDAINTSTTTALTKKNLDYPASSNFPVSTSTGEKNLQTLLKSTVSACPSTKIALLGYSQGAWVIGNALDTNSTQVSAAVNKAIKAVVFYGDPSFVPVKSYDYGTYDHAWGGIDQRGSNELNGYASRIHSWCDKNDLFCQFNGTSSAVHGGYFSKYNASAVSFVDLQLGICCGSD